MIQQIITCDVCKSEKKETNHWFMATSDAFTKRKIIAISHFYIDKSEDRDAYLHFCGRECLHKFIDANLDSLLSFSS